MDLIPDCVDLHMLMAPVEFKDRSRDGIWFIAERIKGKNAKVKLVAMDGKQTVLADVSNIQSLSYKRIAKRYSRFSPELAIANVVLNEIEREKSRLRRLRTRVMREKRTGYRSTEPERRMAKKWNNSNAI